MPPYSVFIFIFYPLAFLLEFCIGGFHYRLHPVNLIGKLAGFFEKLFYNISNGFLSGLFFNLISILTITAIFAILDFIFIKVSIILFYIFFVYIIASFLSTGGLTSTSFKIYKDLKNDDTADARKNLLSLAGRDSMTLDASKIARAVIESIAENTGDGIGSVLFYLALGGITGAVIYKTANLLDSTVGYKNKKYEKFGKFSARLDDILNYLPFRITAFFMLLSVFMLSITGGKKYDFRNAAKSWKSFKKDHPSPNAAQLESVMAGALKIKLGGVNFYGGVESKKPLIGFNYYDNADKENIIEAIRIMELTSILLIIFYTIIIYLISITYIL